MKRFTYHIEADSDAELRNMVVQDWGPVLIRNAVQQQPPVMSEQQGKTTVVPPEAVEQPQAPAQAAAETPPPRRRRTKEEMAAAAAAQAAASTPPAAVEGAQHPAAVEQPATPAPAAQDDVPADPSPDDVRAVMSLVIAKHEAKLGAVRIFLDQHAGGAKNVSAITTAEHRRAVIIAARAWLAANGDEAAA